MYMCISLSLYIYIYTYVDVSRYYLFIYRYTYRSIYLDIYTSMSDYHCHLDYARRENECIGMACHANITVRYRTVQCSAVQYGTVQHNTIAQ